MARDDPQMKLRLPAEMHERLKAEAMENNRSLNAEIIARLRESIDLDEASRLPRDHQAVLERLKRETEMLNRRVTGLERDLAAGKSVSRKAASDQTD